MVLWKRQISFQGSDLSSHNLCQSVHARGSRSPHPDSHAAPKHEMFTSEKWEECVLRVGCCPRVPFPGCGSGLRPVRPGSSQHQNRLPGSYRPWAFWAFPSLPVNWELPGIRRGSRKGRGWHWLYVLGHNSNWSQFSEEKE